MGGGNSAQKQLANAYKEMADATRQAAAMQAESAQQASLMAQEQFDTSLSFLNKTYASARSDLSPYRGEGFAAVDELYQLMGINKPIEVGGPPVDQNYPTFDQWMSMNGGYSKMRGPVNYNSDGSMSYNSDNDQTDTYNEYRQQYYLENPQAAKDERAISRYIMPENLGALTQDQIDQLVTMYNANKIPARTGGQTIASMNGRNIINVKWPTSPGSPDITAPNDKLMSLDDIEKKYGRGMGAFNEFYNKGGATYSMTHPGKTLDELLTPVGADRKSKMAHLSENRDRDEKLAATKYLYDYFQKKGGVGATEWQDDLYNDPNLNKSYKLVYGKDITPRAKTPEELSANALKKLRESPGYQFAFEQGQEALENSKAAAGMLNSGNTLKELDVYGQGMADQQYQQRIANLQQMINTGQASAAQSAQQSISQGQDQAAMRKNLGDTQGSAEMAKGNAMAHGLLTSKRWDILADAAKSQAQAGGISQGFGMLGNVMGMAGGGMGGMKTGGYLKKKKKTLVGENY